MESTYIHLDLRPRIGYRGLTSLLDWPMNTLFLLVPTKLTKQSYMLSLGMDSCDESIDRLL
jgi:hypothetical protein